MKTRIWFIVLLWAGIGLSALGQEMTDLPQGHPRFLTDAGGKEETLRLIEEETWHGGCSRDCSSVWAAMPVKARTG